MRRHNRGRPCFKRNWKKRIQLQKSSDHPIETSIPTSLCTQKLYVQLKMKTVGQDGIDRPETHAVLQENLTTRSEFAPGPLSIHYGCDFGVFVCLFVCFFGFFFFGVVLLTVPQWSISGYLTLGTLPILGCLV